MVMDEAVRMHVIDGGHAGRFTAMASPCEVLVLGSSEQEAAAVAAAAAAEVRRIERHWSRYRDDNIVARINAAQGVPVEVDDETAAFLDYAALLFELSQGRFDVTSGVLRRVWHFDGSDRVPDDAAIAEVLPLVGWPRVQWQRPLLQLPAGMEIDFGGIGKEYAVDKAMQMARTMTTSPVLINCGGDLAVSGPRSDGSPWQIGIHAPGLQPPPMVLLHSGAIATSGDAHRFLLKDGVRYAHVLDPKSGQAVHGGPRAVSVRASSCTEAGVLSTLALLHADQAEAFLQRRQADAKVWW